ncbi:hypothetical protein [Halalkalicoccus sp. NIPERK01]|uniref:hypothetical protein n=1 Tax=Halalkalicoccus sp. NIPERK01 TaxID=3053469 RepID=UPI00256F4FFF|nr:hypothetical protein [Halalkalicoccus sp. NIPERK01]MDL5360770.1 hypothetical protein [Halalkalicoccus sp. NIPERK01]
MGSDWSDEPARLDRLEIEPEPSEVLYGNHDDTPTRLDEADLRPYEAAVYRL